MVPRLAKPQKENHLAIEMCVTFVHLRMYTPHFLKLWPGRLFLSSNFSLRSLDEISEYTRLSVNSNGNW